MAKTMGPFSSEIHKPLLGSPGPGPMYRLNPPLVIFASQGLRYGTITSSGYIITVRAYERASSLAKGYDSGPPSLL
jgi:hypothetical protein